MTDQQQVARAKNIMLALLEKRLSVPRIYLDAKWQGHHVDVLAIDRDGSGDVHAVLSYVRPLVDESLPDTIKDRVLIDKTIEQLAGINAQYKYVLGVATTTRWRAFGDTPAAEFAERTFSPDGLGRVGIVWAAPDDKGGIAADIAIFPERFRAFVGSSADEFIRTHPADWEVRA